MKWIKREKKEKKMEEGISGRRQARATSEASKVSIY